MSTPLYSSRLCAENPVFEIVQESVKVYTTRMSSRTLHAQHPAMQIQYSYYSGINTLYAQNPVFEIVHDESVKGYPHMFNGNVQQNPLCVESCVTKEFAMSPRFSSTMFDPDANSVLLRAHLCTAVDSMRRNSVFKIVQESVKVCTTGNCSRKRNRTYAVLK